MVNDSRQQRCTLGRCDGSMWLWREEAAVECPCRSERIRSRRQRRLMTDLPALYRRDGAELTRKPVIDLPAALLAHLSAYAETIDERIATGEGLWLQGANGTGKTAAAVAVSKAAVRRGHSVGFHVVPELLNLIRDSYEETRGHQAALDRLNELDLLVLDDLGAERTMPWVLEQFYLIVNRRALDRKPLIVTTDLTSGKLAEQVTPRVVSRLHGICGRPLEFGGPDRREQRAAA